MQLLVPTHICEKVTARLRTVEPTIDTVPIESGQPPPPNRAEILLRFFPNSVYPGRAFDAATLERTVSLSPQLRWIHNGMTGMDGVLYPQLVESNIIVTNGSGAHRHAIAESALGMMLAWAKRYSSHLDNQRRRCWQHIPHDTLHDENALIIGLGSIGQTIAQLCSAFGMRVAGVRKHDIEEPVAGVSQIVTSDRLHDLLPEADYVIIATVLTPETRRMIAEAELRLMKPAAYVVNIARGGIIDEQALYQALSEGWIAGAGLDVFAQEPLPSSSPLWTLPNVTITPHNAAWSDHVEDEALSIFYENFSRYVQNRPLLNVVDKEAGY